MIYFNSDYLEGAHPEIMKRLAETNMVQTVGYGEDEYCASARARIRAACDAPDADIHFFSGGTQANTTVIAAILRPWQGVLSAASGHINCHEAGAIEATGHKVIALPTDDGKITARQIEDYVHWHRTDPSSDFIVQPGMVYISHPTECGTLYTKSELTAIYDACQRCGLRLFIDGARLAKGRLLGIQFDALFTDDLYLKISRHAIDMAHQIREIFVSAGYPLLFDSPTNQQYPILPDSDLAELGKSFGYEYWERVDETHSGVRFCASWATTQENVDALRAAVQALKK